MEILEFKKGDPDNLEGKVIIYSKLKDNQEDNQKYEGKYKKNLFGFYLTTDPLDLVKKVGVPQEVKEKAKKLDELLKGIFELSKEFFGADEIEHAFGAPIPIESEEDLVLGEEDVIFVGEYSYPDVCIGALKHSAHLYLFKLAEQKKDEKQTTSKHYKSKFKHYSSVENLKEELIKDYVVPMTDAFNYKKEKEFNKTKTHLYSFSSGAPFFTTIPKLIKIIEDIKNPDRNKLIEMYVNKIVAINSENYEEAAKIKREIEKLE